MGQVVAGGGSGGGEGIALLPRGTGGSDGGGVGGRVAFEEGGHLRRGGSGAGRIRFILGPLGSTCPSLPRGQGVGNN